MNKFYSVSFDETNKEFSVRIFADSGYYLLVRFYLEKDAPGWQVDDRQDPPFSSREKAMEYAKKWMNDKQGDLKHAYKIWKCKDKNGLSDDEYNTRVGKVIDSGTGGTDQQGL